MAVSVFLLLLVPELLLFSILKISILKDMWEEFLQKNVSGLGGSTKDA